VLSDPLGFVFVDKTMSSFAEIFPTYTFNSHRCHCSIFSWCRLSVATRIYFCNPEFSAICSCSWSPLQFLFKVVSLSSIFGKLAQRQTMMLDACESASERDYRLLVSQTVNWRAFAVVLVKGHLSLVNRPSGDQITLPFAPMGTARSVSSHSVSKIEFFSGKTV